MDSVDLTNGLAAPLLFQGGVEHRVGEALHAPKAVTISAALPAFSRAAMAICCASPDMFSATLRVAAQLRSDLRGQALAAMMVEVLSMDAIIPTSTSSVKVTAAPTSFCTPSIIAPMSRVDWALRSARP